MSVKRISLSCAPLYNVPRHDAELETQCLFGEQFDVVNTEGEFAQGRLVTDDYPGWVPLSALSEVPEPTHRVIAPCSWARAGSDIKSASMQPLYAGSLSCVESVDGETSSVDLLGKTGYLPTSHITPLSADAVTTDWVSVAEQFIGVPYVWGGRTFVGLDCSALVQLAAQTANIPLPRNTSEQQVCFDAVDSVAHLSRGDLVFWKGHVGVMQSHDQLLHANAYHMQVYSEPLQDAIERITNIAGPVTALRRLP